MSGQIQLIPASHLPSPVLPSIGHSVALDYILRRNAQPQFTKLFSVKLMEGLGLVHLASSSDTCIPSL